MAKLRRPILVGQATDGPKPVMNRTEEISLEKFSLGWPWFDARNAAALACELIRWVMPVPMWVAADDPRVDAVNKHIKAEVPNYPPHRGLHPYREQGEQKVSLDPPEVTEARFEVVNILAHLSHYVHNEPVRVPQDFGEPDDPPMKKLYWYATKIGKRAAKYGQIAGEVVTRLQLNPQEKIWLGGIDPWYHTGHAAEEACEFLRKQASANQTVGMVDGAGGAVLHRISWHLAFAGKPTAEITSRMFHWRVQDALRGRSLSPEMEANLKPAFEAAWMAQQYDFAYGLLSDIDQLVEQ